MAMSSRIRRAKDCGYQAYLEENYTLDQVRGFYGPKLETFEQVYIPYKDHPSAELFYEFYDHFLTELTTETQACLLYTSGSFPTPCRQCVVLEDQGVFRHKEIAALAAQVRDRDAAAAGGEGPVFHDHALAAGGGEASVDQIGKGAF